MSLVGQLHPHYGKNDIVGVHRDTDLVLALFREHPEVSQFRDKVVGILAQNPEKGTHLRNRLQEAYGDMGKPSIQEISDIDAHNLSGVDKLHFTYQNLLAFRYFAQRYPVAATEIFLRNIKEILTEYGLNEAKIVSIGQSVGEVTGEDFGGTLENLKTHVERIAFLEGCIERGIFLSEIIEHAQYQRDKLKKEREASFEYWDYNNIVVLAQTRKRGLNRGNDGGKSFSLSGGSGNALTQLSIISKYIESGGHIRSISGTSLGSTIAVLVGSIGDNRQKMEQLMQDIQSMNELGEIPKDLRSSKNQKAFLSTLKRLLLRYGINDKTRFSDLKIPVVINAGRQSGNLSEQEIVLGGNELVIDSIMASMNVPIGSKNIGKFGGTKVHGVPMIDYAANERGNPTHWLELLGEAQKNIVAIDVGYSSERGGSPLVRRLFQRATIRDFYAKMRIATNGGIVIDAPLESKEGYLFPPGAIERFYKIGEELYKKFFNEQVE
ncbi:MAG: hypothetical protein HHAS10_04210 [Candidatus Altimarinota bacterium]